MATEDSEEAFSGQTVPLDVEEREKVQKIVVANSRKKYAVPKAKVEAYMEGLLSDDIQAPPKKSVVVRKKAVTTSSKMHDL